jgi:hypothetical protein
MSFRLHLQSLHHLHPIARPERIERDQSFREWRRGVDRVACRLPAPWFNSRGFQGFLLKNAPVPLAGTSV